MRRNRLRIVNVRGLRSQVAGVEGVEPSHTAPETAVLPLDDTPSIARCRTSVVFGASASEYISLTSARKNDMSFRGLRQEAIADETPEGGQSLQPFGKGWSPS